MEEKLFKKVLSMFRQPVAESVVIAVVALICMALFEHLKHVIFDNEIMCDNAIMWEMHVLTATSSSLLAGIIAYWVICRTRRIIIISEDRFRSLFQQAAVGVAEIAMETGQFIVVNKRLCEIVGRTEAELLVTTFQAITHPEDIYLHEEKTRMLLAGEIRSYSLEKRYFRKDQEVIWMNITVSPLWKLGEKPERNMIVAEDITQRKKSESAIQRLAYYDSLTGLPNRRLFFDRLTQNIIQTKRKKGKMAVMMLDLDYLKGINDNFGHKAGDILIEKTGKRIAEVLRAGDTVSRVGGDEFTVIIAEIDQLQDVEAIAKKIIEKVGQPLEISEGFITNPSIGLGIAIFPEHGSDGDTLVKNADVAMYKVKHTGGYQVYSEN